MNYILKDRDAEMHHSSPEAIDNIPVAIRDEIMRLNAKRIEYEAVTITQSWHVKESKLFPAEVYNEIGRELVERFAPGHLAWVTTHTEKDHIHNHITICNVHSETGKALQRDKVDIHRLHAINNEIAARFGLMKNEKKFRGGRESWILDMGDKIDFARAASTSFDEFRGTLKGLGIDINIENKNITYFYRGHDKGTRGYKLGEVYDKPGLIKTFKENDERFASNPKLREQFRADIRAAFDSKGNSLGTPSDLLLESATYRGLGSKDYNEYTKIPRNKSRSDLPSIFDKRGGPLYLEMMKARELSIFDYCEMNKIKTKLNDKGEKVLVGREFVVLMRNEWINTKNRTRGNIIDFVSIHDRCDYMQAVSKLTGNRRILLLHEYMDQYNRKYQSFFFPMPKAASSSLAIETLNKFLNSHNFRGSDAETLLKSKRIFIGSNKSIWFLNESGDSALEIWEQDRHWKTKRHGDPSSVFHESIIKSKRLIVFPNPFEFALLKSQGIDHNYKGASTLVFFNDEGSKRRVDELLALHPHIQEIHFVQSSKSENLEREMSVFREMKKKLDPFSIEVKAITFRDLHKGRELGTGIEI